MLSQNVLVAYIRSGCHEGLSFRGARPRPSESGISPRGAAAAFSGPHDLGRVQRSPLAAGNDGTVDSVAELIIFLVVLSMRGASRGVLEVGQSGAE
jgi:hypothetical protein